MTMIVYQLLEISLLNPGLTSPLKINEIILQGVASLPFASFTLCQRHRLCMFFCLVDSN